ncbi:MAG: PKD domain-containing protein, partial [Chloroflexota bacterium]
NLSVSSDGPTLLGDVTAFNATALGSNVNYSWDFGDGQNGVGATISHTYASAGVFVATATAANSSNTMTQTTTVTVTETPQPVLSITPLHLMFNAVSGDSNPADKALTIENSGTGTLDWALSEDTDWLQLGSTSGTGSASVPVSVDVTGLAAGTYTSQITGTGNGALNSPQTIDVTLIVDAPPPPQPINLTTYAGPANIRLYWNSSSDLAVTNYRVLRAISGSSSYTSIATVNQTNYLDKDAALVAGTTYCYKVEALRSDNSIVVTSNLSCAVFGTTQLWVPDVTAAVGQIAYIPINVRNAAGLRIAASDIWLEFDGTVINPLAVFSTPLTQGYNWAQASLSSVDGKPNYKRIKIATLSNNPLTLYGSGSLFWLKVRVLGAPGDETPLDLREFISGVGGSTIYTPDDLVNPIPLFLDDGVFQVSNNYILGDLNGNGVVESIDAYIALRIAIGRLSPTLGQLYAGDINGNGRIDVGDASMIFYYVTYGQWPLNSSGSSPLLAQTDTPVTLSIDNVAGQPGSTVQTTIRAENLTEWAGGKFVITYDPSVINKIVGVSATGLASGLTVEVNDDQAGQLQIALASDTPITGSGALLTISLEIAANTTIGDQSPLVLAEAELNDVSGRDFAASALQTTINRTSGQLEVGIQKHIYLPIITNYISPSVN